MKALVSQVEQSLKKTVDVQDTASVPLPDSPEHRMRRMKYRFTHPRKTPLPPSPEKNTSMPKNRGQNAQEIPLSPSPKKGIHQSRLPLSSTAMSELYLQRNKIQRNIPVSAPLPSSSHGLAGRPNPAPATMSGVDLYYNSRGNESDSDSSTNVVVVSKKPRRQHSTNFSRPFREVSVNAVSTCGSSLSDSGQIDMKGAFESAQTVPSARDGWRFWSFTCPGTASSRGRLTTRDGGRCCWMECSIAEGDRGRTMASEAGNPWDEPAHINLEASHSQNSTPIIPKRRKGNHSSTLPKGLTVIYHKVTEQAVIISPHRRATVTKSILRPISSVSSRPRPTAIFEYYDFNDGYLEPDSELNTQVEEDPKESTKTVGFSAMKAAASRDGKKIVLEPVVENEGKTSRNQGREQEKKKGARMRKSRGEIVEPSSDDGVPIIWTHPPSEREGGYKRVRNLPSSLLSQGL